MKNFLALIFCILFIAKPAFAFINPEFVKGLDQDSINELTSLEEVLGAFPPNINNQEEFDVVTNRYNKLKSLLDKKLSKEPNNPGLLLARAWLQLMGHNMDKEGAFQGAETDLLHLLKDHPNNEEGLLLIARLYVNAEFSLAPKAEDYFKKAQEVHGPDLLESAQRGLWFAYYYQGKMCDALKQAQLLVNKWKNDQYQKLLEISTEKVGNPNTCP